MFSGFLIRLILQSILSNRTSSFNLSMNINILDNKCYTYCRVPNKCYVFCTRSCHQEYGLFMYLQLHWNKISCKSKKNAISQGLVKVKYFMYLENQFCVATSVDPLLTVRYVLLNSLSLFSVCHLMHYYSRVRSMTLQWMSTFRAIYVLIKSCADMYLVIFNQCP